jgi:hypothetical protein
MDLFDSMPEPWATRSAVLAAGGLGVFFYFAFPDMPAFGIGVATGALITFVMRWAFGISDRRVFAAFLGWFRGKGRGEVSSLPGEAPEK